LVRGNRKHVDVGQKVVVDGASFHLHNVMAVGASRGDGRGVWGSPDGLVSVPAVHVVVRPSPLYVHKVLLQHVELRGDKVVPGINRVSCLGPFLYLRAYT
jgi:hypothetical protein